MLKIEINNDMKKKLIVGSIILLVIALILCVAFYISNSNFRSFIDRYILRKEIVQNNVANIDISTFENPSIYAYDKYITILNKNKLTAYSALGKKEFEHEILISNPIYASNNNFLVIAEKGGQHLYFISEQNLVWQTEIEGNIRKN